MTVRAKFRCLEITRRYDGTVTAKLMPVMKKNGKHHPENEEFFKYSPSGKCELNYQGECPLEVGAYYYLDFDRVVERAPNGEIVSMPVAGDNPNDEAGSWCLRRRVEDYDNVQIEMGMWKQHDHTKPRLAGLFSGSFEVQLSVSASGARSALSTVKSLWNFSCTFAEKSDD